jgi:hypothetical protein
MMLARSTPARKTELDRIARQLDGLERQATALGAYELAYVVELARIAALQERACAKPANENRLGGVRASIRTSQSF